jgi:UTP-glucose-1-phosphate uridylyltransferase
MIYKFRKQDQDSILEVENITELENVGIVELTIITHNGTRSISLYKDDVYKLIGALHLLHKEMK